jgi:hypothetical protein
MKMRTKILTAALFAGILFGTMDRPETEKLAFAFTAPTAALLDYSITLSGAHLKVDQADANFIRLAQR